MTTRLQVLRALADGKVHSGADIGRKLGVTRAAVSKGVKSLVAHGLVVQAAPGVGYQLEAPLTPLDGRVIRRHLARARSSVRIELLETVDSTNRHLLAQALLDPDPSGRVCIADVQPHGRGRRGKSWVATPYQNIMLSIAWRFAVGPSMVSGLSLAAGVAVTRALEAFGVRGIGLKWPNDVLWTAMEPPSDGKPRGSASPERKLAGLLVDVHGEASGPCTVVLGVGVNCRLAPSDARFIDQPWTDIYRIAGRVPDRNRLAALLIEQLYEALLIFAQSGFAAFQAEWDRRHLYADRTVRMSRGDVLFEGIVEGIDEHGALRLRAPGGGTQVFHSGEVSLRSTSL